MSKHVHINFSCPSWTRLLQPKVNLGDEFDQAAAALAQYQRETCPAIKQSEVKEEDKHEHQSSGHSRKCTCASYTDDHIRVQDIADCIAPIKQDEEFAQDIKQLHGTNERCV